MLLTMATTWRELRGVLWMGLGLCIGASIVMYLLLPSLLAGRALYRDVLGFVETPRTQVRTGTIRDHPPRAHIYYMPLLICEYQVGDSRLETDNSNSELGFAIYHSRDLALAAAEQARTLPQHAYYDPHDPARAAMSREVYYNDGYWAIVGIAGLAAALGVFSLIAFAIRGRRLLLRGRREHDDFPSARVR